MKNKSFSKTKFSIAWASIVTIFIGAVVYVPALKFSQKEKEVVYYRVPVFVNMTPSTENGAQPANSQSEKEEPLIKVSTSRITKDLKLGDVDEEVKFLQEYLNGRGFLVAESGPGSPGEETTRFGAGTRDALIKFQETNADLILKPFGLKEGTGVVGEMTRKLINS